MSISDDRDLRTRLAGLLDGVEPAPAPVATTIRAGGRLRLRRRITAVAGVAAVAAVVAVIALAPAVLSGRPHAGPVSPARHTVTVTTLGPVARDGVIGAGVSDGKRWRVVISGSPHSPDIHAHGAIGDSPILAAAPEATPQPVNEETVGDNKDIVIAATVAAAVTSVQIRLPSGSPLDLRPVQWGGQRWVAFVLPAGDPIVRAVAYDSTRELAYSVPFRGTGLDTWWQPGQSGPARQTRVIGAGVTSGSRWRYQALIGPWGWCYAGDGASDCAPAGPAAMAGSRPVALAGCRPGGQTTPATGIAVAGSGLARLVLQLGNGRTVSFRAVAVSGGRALGFAIPAGQRVVAAREYGAGGQLLGSQRASGRSLAPWSSCE